MEVVQILFLVCAGVNSLLAVKENNWHSLSGWACAILWCISSFK